VLGLRADFSDRALEYALLARALRECQIIVEPMVPAHLWTIITRPAQTTGLVLQDGFVDLLLRDTGRAGRIAAPVVHGSHAASWRRWGCRESRG
jgi:Novel STAND NTPase 1